MKPIHKFNSGMGATLCHKCRVIINVGFSEELYCKNCIKLKEMKQEKLYTEEQTRSAIKSALDGFGIGQTEDTIDVVMSKLIPIELPSDEEIARVALEETTNINEQILFNNGAIYICKLIEKQIIKQNK